MATVYSTDKQGLAPMQPTDKRWVVEGVYTVGGKVYRYYTRDWGYWVSLEGATMRLNNSASLFTVMNVRDDFAGIAAIMTVKMKCIDEMGANVITPSPFALDPNEFEVDAFF